jgi:predicted enzyme related to lactoylglutathione lyase
MVNIDVERLDAAIRFYEQGLGLRVKRRLFGGTVAELSGAAVPIFLLQKPAGTPIGNGSTELRNYRRHWTAVHLDLVVAAIEPAIERAQHAGARSEGPVQAFQWGRQVLMSDPFGNGFCLIQWLGSGYDVVTS